MSKKIKQLKPMEESLNLIINGLSGPKTSILTQKSRKSNEEFQKLHMAQKELPQAMTNG